MCLNPVKLRNPTRHISTKGGQPLLIEVQCNHCAECKKEKRMEYRFRSLYQSKDCIRKGGYVYFDTLTYDDAHVPHLSDFVDISNTDIADFTCFDNSHWRNFLKNLRRQLNYHYKDVTFKYFLTSEYGTDDRYTHRPHYHVLFFVNSNSCDPLNFSRLVSKCWQYGRTDGIPYQTANYVYDHCVTVDSDVMKICNYVAKYVTKDSTFQSKINERLTKLQQLLNDDDKYNELKCNISMFHRQSQGYGLYYLQSLSRDDYDYLLKHGAIRMKDSEQVVATLKLPLYYKRKLFYKCLKDADNKLFWQLNRLGVDYTRDHMVKSHAALSAQYRTLFENATSLEKRYINTLLNGRSFDDFTAYKLFYKGRVRDLDACYNYVKGYARPRLSDKEINIYDWINSIIQSSYVRTSDNPLMRDVDNNMIDVPYTYGNLFHDYVNKHNYDYTSFIKNVTHDENSCPAFRNFDKLDALFKVIKAPDSKQAQKTFDFIEDLEKRFKILFNYG